MVWTWAEHSPFCTLQAEVWNLDMLRSNHSTWPVDVSQIKQGFIMVKGHSTVSLQLTASLLFPFSYVSHLFLMPIAAQIALLAFCPWGRGSQRNLYRGTSRLMCTPWV